MKDQYVADIGDYGKYSLLRAFKDAGVSVGINWYLTEDDGTKDGKFRRYLDDNTRKSLKPYDPEVFDVLKQINKTERTIKGLEKSELLKGVCFYDERMIFEGDKNNRRNKRVNWHREAVKKLEGCSLVFLDPDNGLREVRKDSHKEEKYVLSDEIKAYYENQNVVFYCHKGRRTEKQWEQYKLIMPKILPSARPIVLTYHKGTQRSYIFLIHPEDYKKYREIIDAFLERWKGIFSEEQIKAPGFYEFATKWSEIIREDEKYEWIFDSMEFADDAREAGCEMDAFNSFSEVFPKSKAIKDIEALKDLLRSDNRITSSLLGAMIFSQWRYYNHWAYSSPEAWVREWFIIALEHLKTMSKQ